MSQAAVVLGLSTWAVRGLIAGGRLPTVDLGVRRVLVDRARLDALLAG